MVVVLMCSYGASPKKEQRRWLPGSERENEEKKGEVVDFVFVCVLCILIDIRKRKSICG